MMVPSMQKKLLTAVLESSEDVETVFDPFVGSGTIMTESMRRGLHFYGQDINPMSILICKVKMGPFCTEAVKNASKNIICEIEKDDLNKIEVNFNIKTLKKIEI